MTNELELPRFKYFPHAFSAELGLFKRETFTCDVCKTERDYRYVGAYYMEREVSKGTVKVTNPEHKICAHCIESGKAAEILNADFKDVEILEESCYNKEHIDEEMCDKVIETWLYKTPNFTAIETETWPICCSNFTAFIGYLGRGDNILKHLKIDGKTDLTKITADLEKKTEEELFADLEQAFKDEATRLKKNGSKVKNSQELIQKIQSEENFALGYLFKCLDCDKYYVHLDLL
jgi:uncharacterized protein CbrC (UPF0167 family)